MKQYLDFTNNILQNGCHRIDRTGVGTTSVFIQEMRFDLQKGFPAITTKKLALKSVITELLWFIEGSGDERRLRELLHGDYNSPKPTIWTGNAEAPYWRPKGLFEGDLGVIYGNMWRKWPTDGLEYDTVPTRAPEVTKPYEVSAARKMKRGLQSKIYKLWLNIHKKCYDPSYPQYDKNLTVSADWQDFDKFEQQIKSIAGFYIWAKSSTYDLDALYYNSSQFSRSTSIFLPKRYIKKMQSGPASNFRRIYYIDQLAKLIADIKSDPYSRRQILTGWNVSELKNMALPPCHTFSQFYVADGKLSCALYCRSQDVFLGTPFNIASYSIFVHMLAQVCGLEVGEYIHIGGDCHLYDNHLDAVKEQLSREPLPLATLRLNPDIKNIDDFKLEDIIIEGYQSHPAIKAPMAV